MGTSWMGWRIPVSSSSDSSEREDHETAGPSANRRMPRHGVRCRPGVRLLFTHVRDNPRRADGEMITDAPTPGDSFEGGSGPHRDHPGDATDPG
jgi:hypothetical protein